MKEERVYDIKKMRRKLQRELDEDRYIHTLGVMDTAACLAMRYGAPVDKALVAGLLHDCAKCIPNDKKLKLCKKYRIKMTPFELNAPFLLHAKLGAYLAKKDYGVEDKEILSAIACHTTGKPAMSLLDKIVFLADYIEPGRSKAPNLAEIRSLAFMDLHRALIRVLADTLEYLYASGQPVDPMTREVLDYYLTEDDAY